MNTKRLFDCNLHIHKSYKILQWWQFRKSIFIFLTAVLLSSCVPSYRMYDWWGSTGYQETFLAPDIATVSYTGNERLTYERVNDFVILRAAELALQNNYKYFVIKSKLDLTQQKISTSGGNETTKTETKSQEDGSKVKTTQTEYKPPVTKVEEHPKIMLEVQFFHSKPGSENSTEFVYESIFINNSIKSKYGIEP